MNTNIALSLSLYVIQRRLYVGDSTERLSVRCLAPAHEDKFDGERVERRGRRAVHAQWTGTDTGSRIKSLLQCDETTVADEEEEQESSVVSSCCDVRGAAAPEAPAAAAAAAVNE